MERNIKQLFKKVKLLILDVDGVLTKGEIIYDSRGKEFKIFNVKDGLGVSLLGKAGIKTILLTARDSEIVKRRAWDMKAAEVIGGILPKEKNLPGIIKRYGVSADEICFVGDDLIDLELIKKVGLGVAVADAHSLVKKSAKYVTVNKGGEGAVREIVDLIFKAKNLEEKVYAWVKNPQ